MVNHYAILVKIPEPELGPGWDYPMRNSMTTIVKYRWAKQNLGGILYTHSTDTQSFLERIGSNDDKACWFHDIVITDEPTYAAVSLADDENPVALDFSDDRLVWLIQVAMKRQVYYLMNQIREQNMSRLHHHCSQIRFLIRGSLGTRTGISFPPLRSGYAPPFPGYTRLSNRTLKFIDTRLLKHLRKSRARQRRRKK